MKLGEKIGEFTGKITSSRVVASEGKPHSLEVSANLTGSILGVKAEEVVTFTNYARDDGSVIGEGHGLLMTADGERVQWCGGGLGRLKEGGAGRSSSTLYFETKSAKLSRLNRIIGLTDDTIDASGNVKCEVYEVVLPE